MRYLLDKMSKRDNLDKISGASRSGTKSRWRRWNKKRVLQVKQGRVPRKPAFVYPPRPPEREAFAKYMLLPQFYINFKIRTFGANG